MKFSSTFLLASLIGEAFVDSHQCHEKCYTQMAICCQKFQGAYRNTNNILSADIRECRDKHVACRAECAADRKMLRGDGIKTTDTEI